MSRFQTITGAHFLIASVAAIMQTAWLPQLITRVMYACADANVLESLQYLGFTKLSCKEGNYKLLNENKLRKQSKTVVVVAYLIRLQFFLCTPVFSSPFPREVPPGNRPLVWHYWAYRSEVTNEHILSH